METKETPRAFTAEETRDRFLELVASYVTYWEKESRQPGIREKLEGLAFSLMVILDGGSATLPSFIVQPNPHPSDKDYHTDNGENYYDDTVDIAGELHDNIHKFLKRKDHE